MSRCLCSCRFGWSPRLTVSGDDLSDVLGGSWSLRSREEEAHSPCCVMCLAYAPLIDLLCVPCWTYERMTLLGWM